MSQSNVVIDEPASFRARLGRVLDNLTCERESGMTLDEFDAAMRKAAAEDQAELEAQAVTL